MNLARLSVVAVLLLLFAGTASATECHELHLRKIAVKHASPSKRGVPRSSLRLVGRLESHRIPLDFRFDPRTMPFLVHVGGTTVFQGPGAGEWRQTSLDSWTYREKGAPKWRISLDFYRGEFVIKGKKLDLSDLEGPVDCDVFIVVDEMYFGCSVSGREQGPKWTWVRAPGGIPSRAPGSVPAAGIPTGEPGEPVPPGTPVDYAYRTLGSGDSLTTNVPPGGGWQDRLVISNRPMWEAQWKRVFSNQSAPTVDFSRERVALVWVRGNTFADFEVLADNATVYVNYKNVATPGPRSYVFKAVTIPVRPTSVVFSMMF